MLLDAGLPMTFWGEAIKTACYLLHRTPASSLIDFKSPYELLHGVKPRLHHLQRFGCTVYKHIPKEQRHDKKFGIRSRPCMMIGYVHKTTKIWKLWDWQTKRAIECSNTIFHEEENAIGATMDNAEAAMQRYDNAVQFPTDNEEIDDSNTDDIIDDMSRMLTLFLTIATFCFFTLIWPTLPPAKDAALRYGQRCHSYMANIATGQRCCVIIWSKIPLYKYGQKLPLYTTSYLFIHDKSYKNILTYISLESPHSYIARRTTSRGRVENNQRNVHLAHETGGECLISSGFMAMTNIKINKLLDNNEALITPISNNPTSYKEAMESPDCELWKEATLAGWASLLENGTFEHAHMPLKPPGHEDHNDQLGDAAEDSTPYGIMPIGCKWVYKVKRNPDNTTRNKVRLVIKGYEQVEGIDFNGTYVPVFKLTMLRFLLDQAAQHNWSISHMYMVTAFLNPKIDIDDVYIAMPQGIECIDKRLKQTSVVQLLKALYGLKQAPRLWYQDINEFLLSINFKQSNADQNLYIKQGVLLLLYVDDLLIVDTSSHGNEATKVKEKLSQKYKMTNLGEARRFLGLEICKTRNGYTLG
jgi:hypothetical protein